MKRVAVHRRIYTLHHGPIPKGWHVHHIDGNSSNNDPANLIALTPEDHYLTHALQGDMYFQQPGTAALAGARGRLKTLELGKNYFRNMPFEKRSAAGKKGGSISGPKVAALYFTSEHQSKAGVAANRTMLSRGSHSSQRGTAGFQQKDLASTSGHKQTQKVHTCPHCGKIGKSNAMLRYHFDRCKHALD